MPVGPTTYLYSSVVVGLAQVIDAFVLARFKGRIGAIATAFSLVDYLWAGVSFFVWREAQPAFPLWLPVSFVAYVAAFAAAGLVLAARHRGEVKPVPKHLVVAGGVFGAYFCATSLFYAAGAYPTAYSGVRPLPSAGELKRSTDRTQEDHGDANRKDESRREGETPVP